MHPWERYYRARFWGVALLFAALAGTGVGHSLEWPASARGIALTAALAGVLLAIWGQWRWMRRLGVARDSQPLFPEREGNRIEILIDGEAVLGRLASEIAGARQRVWITAAFIDPRLSLPGCNRTLIELLAGKAREGVDVRVLCWRLGEQRHGNRLEGGGFVFHDNAESLALLESLGAPIKLRWDTMIAGCHHQKTAVIDSRGGFCGGVNLVGEALDSPTHRFRYILPPWHDLAAVAEGPVVADLEGNFIQRWNGAREPAPWPDPKAAGPLRYPEDIDGWSARTSPGTSPVQLLRTLPAGQYRNRLRVPGGAHTHGSSIRGESSVVEGYLALVEGARESLYLENQYFFFDMEHFPLESLPRRYRVKRADGRSEHILCRAIREATNRGVEVWLVLPGHPQFRRTHRRWLGFLEGADPEHLGLFSLVTDEADLKGEYVYRDIYIHSKLAIADRVETIVGSANFSWQSLHRDSEAALRIRDGGISGDLLERLQEEHLGGPQESALVPLARWQKMALENARRVVAGERLQGRVVPLTPELFGESPAVRFRRWLGN